MANVGGGTIMFSTNERRIRQVYGAITPERATFGYRFLRFRNKRTAFGLVAERSSKTSTGHKYLLRTELTPHRLSSLYPHVLSLSLSSLPPSCFAFHT